LLVFVAVAIEIAAVHAEEHIGPIAAFGASGAGMNAKEAIGGVVFGVEQGGQLETGNWFRGDAAFFGGVKWDLNEKTSAFAEYSSDAYDQEQKEAEISNTELEAETEV